MKTRDASYRAVVADAKENPWKLFDVAALRLITGTPVKEMTRLRKLAAIDAISDPWAGGTTLTRPETFIAWYFGKRIELERDWIVPENGPLQRAQEKSPR